MTTYTPGALRDWEVGFGPNGVTGPNASVMVLLDSKVSYEIVSAPQSDPMLSGVNRVIAIIPRADGQADKVAKLIAASPGLLEALKELREACAACFRVIAEARLSERIGQELANAGVAPGFGVRAEKAIAQAQEGK